MSPDPVAGLSRAAIWRRRLVAAFQVVLLLVLMLGWSEGPRAETILANFTLVNDGGAASGERVLSFGQMFPRGAIAPGKAISVSLSGAPAEAQIDPKALWPDGSVRHAVVSVLLPKMQRGDKLAGVIMPAPVAAALPPLPQQAAPALHVTLTFAEGGGRADFDLPTLVREKKGEGWLEGPLVRERRYMGPVVNGIQLAFDVWWPVAGTPSVDVIFHNDRSDDADIDTRVYDAVVTLDGHPVYSAANVRQYAHSVWHKRVGAGAAPRVVPDLALLKQTGAVPRYADIEPDPREMANFHTTTLDEGAPPLDTSGLTMYMPTTGGRADIGPLPTWAVFYLLDPSRENEKSVMATGDAAGSVPWHVRDDATGGPIRIDQHPDVWLDGRGHAVPGALARKYYVSDTKWTPDDAHQPSLSYLPYLLTGSQFYRDELAMQAGYVLLAVDPAYHRGGADGIVLGSQVRAVAWDLRTLANAAFLLPAANPLQAYFESRLNTNLKAIIDRYVEGHELDAAGELKGYLPGPYAVDGAVAPWQDDYLVMVLGWIDSMGFRQAKPVLHWMANFTAGRFTSGARGYDPIYGTPYFLYVREPGGGPWINTWAGAFRRTFDPNKPVTKLDYPDWGGGYAALARGALATLLNSDPSPQVAAAYDFVREHTSAMTDNYSRDPTFAIAPPPRARQAAGNVLAGPGRRMAP